MKRSKTAAFAAAFIMTLNFLPPAVKAEETVSISTISDFRSFTEKCVYDEYSKNKKFVLQNDIDLHGEEIKSAQVFCGVFEGGGYSIKNLKLTAEGSDKGLFGNVTKDGQIRDLNVSGEISISDDKDANESIFLQRAESILSRTDVKTENGDERASSAGGIAGRNSGKIVNCSFEGKIDGINRVGGIAGYNAMTGVIDSCANSALVSGIDETGGIAGYNEGRIKLSKNKGTICPEADENTKNIGGVSGNSEGAVVMCSNDGAVGSDSFGDNAGGICGKQSGEIRECINNGAVDGRRSVGGICGRFEPYTDIELSYESAKAAVEKQADILKNDLESAKSKILDYALGLLDGKEFISSLSSELGLSGAADKASSRLDTLTDAASNMMNSVADGVNSVSDGGLSDSIKDAFAKAGDSLEKAGDAIEKAGDSVEKGSDSLSSFTDETKDALKDAGESLDNSLESLDDFLSEFDGKGDEISALINNLNDSLDEGRADVNDIQEKLGSRLDDMSSDADRVIDNLDETHDSLLRLSSSLRATSSELGDVLDRVEDALDGADSEMKKLKNNIDSLKNKLKELADEIIGTIESTNKPQLPGVSLPTRRPSESPSPSPEAESGTYRAVPDEIIDGGYDVEPSVVGMIKDFLAPRAYAEENKTAISDLKSADISLPRLIGDENADTALIKYCVNNGEVNGVEQAGGIAGGVGFESVVRSGESITLPDGTKVDGDSVLKAVVDACISGGKITAKSNYAGGICGKSDIGNIKNSLSYGEIEVSDGSYAGGAAGMSGGEIVNCAAVNDIAGNDHIGGIAGSGKDIRNSYSLPRLDGSAENSGAIAGAVSGDIENTYFIDEGLSGIDGVNLEGRAEAIKPEDMASSEGVMPEKLKNLGEDGFYMEQGGLYMPQIRAIARNDAESIGATLQSKSSEMAKFRFNVVFRDKDREVKAITVDYGTVLDESDIPKLGEENGNVPVWDKDVHKPIIRHTVFNAVYNKAATTISTDEEPPLLLAESVFDEGTEVYVKDETVNFDFDGYEKGGAYSFSFNKDAYDAIKVHIRDENKKAAKVALLTDGKWTVTDCTLDNSYVVFEAAKPCGFVILYKKASPVIPVVICSGAAALLIISAFVIRKVRRKNGRGNEKEEEAV